MTIEPRSSSNSFFNSQEMQNLEKIQNQNETEPSASQKNQAKIESKLPNLAKRFLRDLPHNDFLALRGVSREWKLAADTALMEVFKDCKSSLKICKNAQKKLKEAEQAKKDEQKSQNFVIRTYHRVIDPLKNFVADPYKKTIKLSDLKPPCKVNPVIHSLKTLMTFSNEIQDEKKLRKLAKRMNYFKELVDTRERATLTLVTIDDFFTIPIRKSAEEKSLIPNSGEKSSSNKKTTKGTKSFSLKNSIDLPKKEVVKNPFNRMSLDDSQIYGNLQNKRTDEGSLHRKSLDDSQVYKSFENNNNA